MWDEQETKLCNTKKPQPTKSARGEQESKAHFMQSGKGQATPGGGPTPQCTAAGGGHRWWTRACALAH
jgi:hypothetical protein